jgi:hypothetical protein
MDSRSIERRILDSVGTITLEEVLEEENRVNGTDYRTVDSYQDGKSTVYLGNETVQRVPPATAESKLPEIKEQYTKEELETINDQLIEQAKFANTQTGELR